MKSLDFYRLMQVFPKNNITLEINNNDFNYWRSTSDKYYLARDPISTSRRETYQE